MENSASFTPAVRSFATPFQPMVAGARETAMFCKDTLQSMVGGILALGGLTEASLTDFSSLRDIFNGVFMGSGSLLDFGGLAQMNGLTQLVIAGFLLASTRRGFARILGFALIILVLLAHNAGLMASDFTGYAANILDTAAHTLTDVSQSLRPEEPIAEMLADKMLVPDSPMASLPETMDAIK